jgi:hypothetical protein
MAISIHEKKLEYIEIKSIELLKLIVELPIKDSDEKEKNSSEHPSRHVRHKEFAGFGDKITSWSDVRRNNKGRFIEKLTHIQDKRIGLVEPGFTELYKLVDTLLKEPSINAVISEPFLVNNIFNWLIEKHVNVNLEKSLGEEIIEKCSASLKVYNIYIPILYLESKRPFELGEVKFCYLTEEYIRKLALEIEEENRASYLEGLLQYKGQLMGRYVVEAEIDKAVDLARDQVTFSVDVLKITSPSIEYPDVQIFYDVDFRNAFQIQNQILIQLSDELHHIVTHHHRTPIPFMINDLVWETMIKCEIGILHKFLKKPNTERTELDNLAHNAIQKFSKAMSNSDLHERVTQIFTVLESLLLADENSAIIDSVCKYLPKLITKNIDERTETVNVIKEMYKVRSMMMHHAKRKEFKLMQLAQLQVCTRALIIHLIKVSDSKKTKMEILKEIDDLINRA